MAASRDHPEAGHILLHGKKEVFIDDAKGEEGEKEEEANRFASNALIPAAAWRTFTDRGRFSKTPVLGFADEQGIALALSLDGSNTRG